MLLGALQCLLAIAPFLGAFWIVGGFSVAFDEPWKQLREHYDLEDASTPTDSFICSRYGIRLRGQLGIQFGPPHSPGFHLPFLLLRANDDYLHIEVAIGGPFVKPVFVPWSDVFVETLGGQHLGWVQFQFKRCPEVQMLLPEGKAREVIAAEHQDFPRRKQAF
jgi:hypothetical protein